MMPTIDGALEALEQLPDNAPVGSDDWKDAIRLIVVFEGDQQAQETLAEKVAEKFDVAIEEVWEAVKEASIDPKDRLMDRIKQLPKDAPEDDIRALCKEIAGFGFLDELAAQTMLRELAQRVKHRGIGIRDLKKLVRQYRKELEDEAAQIVANAGLDEDNDKDKPILNDRGRVKEALPDAPVPEGLQLPDKYRLLSGGKIERIEDRWIVPVSLVPVFISQKIEDHDDEDQKVYLELVYKKNGRWSSVVAPYDVLNDARKILRLGATGFPASDWRAKALTRYLDELETLNSDILPTTYRIRRLGWREWNGKTVFVWGSYTLGLPKGEGPEVFVESPGEQQLLDALQPGGTWEGWLDEVMTPAMQYPSFRMGIYAALASPLLAHCAVQGFVFHYARRSTRGKTTAAQVAISTAGYPGGPGLPDKPGLCRPWNATRVGPERVFSFLRHVPAYLDDSQEVRSNEDLADIIYMLANGSGRVRGAVRGMQRTATWRLVLLSTGENTLAEASKMAGVLVRAIDWTIEPFEGAQPGTDLAAEALRFKVAASKHYGQALPRFVLSLIKYGVERLASEHLEMTARITQRVRERLDQPNELVDRLAGAFGVIALAGALFHELTVPKDHPLAKVTREEVEEFVAHWFSRLLADVQPVHTHVRAYHEFLAWAMRNKESFYNPQNPDRPQPTQGWLGNYPYRVRGIIGDCVTVPPDLLRSLLEKWGYPYDAVLREWKQEGWLVPGDGQYTRPVRCGKNAPLTRHVVIRILGLEEGEGEGTSAQESFEQEADDLF